MFWVYQDAHKLPAPPHPRGIKTWLVPNPLKLHGISATPFGSMRNLHYSKLPVQSFQKQQLFSYYNAAALRTYFGFWRAVIYIKAINVDDAKKDIFFEDANY